MKVGDIVQLPNIPTEPKTRSRFIKKAASLTLRGRIVRIDEMDIMGRKVEMLVLDMLDPKGESTGFEMTVPEQAVRVVSPLDLLSEV